MLEQTITFDRVVRWIIAALIVLAVIFLTNYLGSVLIPFFVAWLLAYLIYPIVCFVQHKIRVGNRVVSIIISLLFVVGVIAGVTWLIIPPMVEQFERLGELVVRYLNNPAHSDSIPVVVRDWIGDNKENIQNFFRSEEMTGVIRNAMPKVFAVLGHTANIIISIVASMITLIYLFFILMDYESLSASFIKIFPKKSRPFWQALINDVERELNSYIRGQSLVALCIGILFCIGYTIIGFPMAIGLGIMIGVMSLIPYVHSLALIPIVILSLLKSVDTGESFWFILLSAMIVFGIIQIITDMVLVPKIMGKAMRLNPAVLLLSLSVWGALLGFVGLIIALPLTTLLIAYYKRYITKEPETEEKVEKPSE